MLTDSGRYEIAPLPESLQRKIAQSADIAGCNGCELDWRARPAPTSRLRHGAEGQQSDSQ